jgi:CubicO group peptidase (beta-lactamase class C family)
MKRLTASPCLLPLLCICCLLLAGCGSMQTMRTPTPVPLGLPTQSPASGDYWPTDGWRTATPAEQGMDAEKLAQMLDAVGVQELRLFSLLVIRHGYIVSETYFELYNRQTARELYSCTKSFVGTLVGIAVDRGYIESVGQPVTRFFPGRAFGNGSPEKVAMTLENLLTMTSGLDWAEEDATYAEMYRSDDWVRYVLDKPMSDRPGTRFNYCSGCSHVLSAIVQAKTGMNTRDFAQQVLFDPLGIKDPAWSTDASGIPIGGWGLQLAPRDMAKLGFLYLHNGSWDGRQVVSEAWVKAATQKHMETDDRLGYGYQWWTYPRWGAYTALGRYGQTIFVIPSLDLVVVTTGQIENHEPIYQLIEQYVAPAVQG